MCNILPAIWHRELERCPATITEGVKHDGNYVIRSSSSVASVITLTHLHTTARNDALNDTNSQLTVRNKEGWLPAEPPKLTAHSSVLFEKPIVPTVVRKFGAFYSEISLPNSQKLD